MAQHQHVTHPIVLRRLEVSRVVDVTPRMRRVTLTGAQLAAFARDGLEHGPLVSTGFDDHVKLVLAEGGPVETALPVQRAQSIDWPEAPHRRMRDYTPSRWDPVAGELDLDVVRHGDGPAARWAEQAVPGTPLHVAGPKSSLVLPDGLDWVLLAGDETALPAICRFLAERPTDVPVQVVVEVRDPAARQELDLRPGDTVRWVETAEHAPSVISAAVTQTPWWPGTVYTWAAGESRALLPLRRWLTREKHVPKSHQNVTGYWTAEPVDTPTADGPAPVDAHALLSPVPWFAGRAALGLGLLDAVADAPRTVPALAAACGVDEPALGALVDYLVAVDVLVRDEAASTTATADLATDATATHAGTGPSAETAPAGARVRLGPVGEVLLGDDHVRADHEDGLALRSLVALADLTAAVSGGSHPAARRAGPVAPSHVAPSPVAPSSVALSPAGAPASSTPPPAPRTAYERTHGRTLWDDLSTDPDLVAEQLEAARGLPFVARGLPALASWDGVRHAAVAGTGAPALVATAGLEDVAFTVVEPPLVAGVLQAATTRDVGTAEEWPRADLAVVTLALAYRTDAQVRTLLTDAALSSGRLLVVEELTDPTVVPTAHAAEHSLLHLATTGAPSRRTADVVRLAAESGWALAAHTPLGWSFEAFELVRATTR